MKKEDIGERYRELVEGIENARMYDGRGTVDRYVCEDCQNIIFTTYRDKGVTPFTMKCRRCGGTMCHDKTYRKNDVPNYVLVFEWYRPTIDEVLKMSDGMAAHILSGGLLLED